ncbi:hypothetical protein J4E83_001747 [Alternaria metachromatica]|uniref:uncharacterized protein n=1 Tax=Alternaria metachromatica TaxID=283354 RepID=UPI0020C47448|nr:uncharacterized protein J4E83_001747 [Alternaria metachromatica]KAI4634429.1 hypothetical protein J4E83_001747 [Alternaria metachromatica]
MGKRKIQHDPYKQKSLDNYVSRNTRPSLSKTTPKSKEAAPAQPPKPIKTQRKRRREDDDDTDAARPPAQDTRLTRSAKKSDYMQGQPVDTKMKMMLACTTGATDDDTGSVLESENYSDPEGDEEDMFLSSDDNEDEASQPEDEADQLDEDNEDDADQSDEDNEEEADQPDEDNEDEANQFECDADQSDEASQSEDEVNQSDEASQSDDADQTDDDADIHHADDDDMKETQYSLEIPLRDQDLFNVDVTAAEVTSIVEKVLPALLLRKIRNFYRTIAGYLKKSPLFRIPARS